MNSNQHIIDFCKEYVLSGVINDYAILLKGKWGCGKTYFWENEIKKALLDSGDIIENEIWYLSVFGIKTIDDLQDKLFEVAHPILSSDGGKKVIPLAYSFLKSATKYKFNIDIKDIGDALLKSLKNESNFVKLIVIDDIERSDLSPTHLLGFISNFILQDKVRVIFIAEEDEYRKKFKDKEGQNYELVKEKIIGFTFNIVAQKELVLKKYIEDMGIDKLNYLDMQEDFLDIIRTLGLENLRVLKNVLFALSIFLKNMGIEEYLSKKEYIKQLIKIYVILMISKLKGDLLEENKQKICEKMRKIWAAYQAKHMNIIEFENWEKEKIENTNDNNAEKLHSSLEIATILELNKLYVENIWYDVIINNNYSSDMINKFVKEDYQERYNLKQVDSLDKLSNNYEILDSEEFKKYCVEIINKFQEGIYLEFDKIEKIICLFSFFVGKGILNVDEQGWYEIIEKFQKNFKSLLKRHHYNIYDNNYKTTELKKLLPQDIKLKLDEVENQCFENYKQDVKKRANESILGTSNSNNYFAQLIKKDPINTEYNVPIMNLVDGEKLFQWITKQDIEVQFELYNFLERRYTINGSLNNQYYCDYDNVKLLYDKYDEYYNKQNKLYNNKIIYLEVLVSRYQQLVKFMGKQIK